jgi:hypothetical protein
MLARTLVLVLVYSLRCAMESRSSSLGHLLDQELAVGLVVVVERETKLG